MLPLVQLLVRLITSSGVVRRFSSSELPPTEGEWIVFQGDGDRGFGVKVEEDPLLSSSLQRALNYVRSVQKIVRGLGGPLSFPLELSLDRSPPEHWRMCKAEGLIGVVWCAASLPVVELPMRSVEPQPDPLVRVRVFGEVAYLGEMQVGVCVVCEWLDVWMPEVGVRAHGVYRGGEMMVEVDECGSVEGQQVPGVRLDLGEIEMRLSDLVGLRPGAVLNLGEVVLERCFIRLGATVLAEGRFATSEGKLLLTIDSVL